MGFWNKIFGRRKRDVEEREKKLPASDELKEVKSAAQQKPIFEQSETFDIMGGVLTKYKENGKNVSIPSGVIEIADSVFKNSDIEGIYLPEGLRELGPNCFRDCHSLKYIHIPKSLKTIGSQAFYGCEKLVSAGVGDAYSFDFAPDMECIPDYLFKNCTKLSYVRLPEMVKEIGKEVFCCCFSLETLELPLSCTWVGNSAFSACRKLSKITFDPARTRLVGNVFKDCKGLADSDGFIIFSNVLYGYFGEKSVVTIPDGVKEISPSAIDSMGGITHNKHITEIIIPDTVTTICPWAFRDCRNLKRVKMSGNISIIDKSSFEGCSNLEKIVTGKNVPEPLEEIITEIEKRNEDKRKRQEEEQKKVQAIRQITDLISLINEIKDFACSHQGSDNSAHAFTEYLSAKLPSTVFDWGTWSFYEDSIEYRYWNGVWSFSDDGGSEESLILWKCTLVDSHKLATNEQIYENRKLTNLKPYPVYQGTKERFLCKNPFGLNGIFEFYYESYQD